MSWRCSYLRTWSTNQDVGTLSSGEAENYGLVKTATNCIGLQNLLLDMGVGVEITLPTDASAALGRACRRGVGRARHLEVQQIWLQHQTASGRMSMIKVCTDRNLADVLTKFVASRRMFWALGAMCLHFTVGRHALAPTADAGVIYLCSEASAKEGCKGIPSGMHISQRAVKSGWCDLHGSVAILAQDHLSAAEKGPARYTGRYHVFFGPRLARQRSSIDGFPDRLFEMSL